MWFESAEELLVNLIFTLVYLWIVYYLIQYIDFILFCFSILHERIILFP